MRLRITVDDELVGQLDRRVGRHQRSAFISATIRKALEDERRWEDIDAGFGALSQRKHVWDADPAAWVRTQRHRDLGRVG